jgi:hypothetical protein
MAQQQEASLGKDLARGKTVTVSSVEKPGTEGPLAVDGDPGTRWSSAFSDPQWIRVDLGPETTISRVHLRWEAAFGSGYSIQVSLDGEAWTDAYVTNEGFGEEELVSFAPVTGRYVRLLGRTRGTLFGYSLWDFSVYGPG